MSKPQPLMNSPPHQATSETPRKTGGASERINAPNSDLKKQRDLRMDNVKDHTISCPPVDWFTTFLRDSSNDKWSAETASQVLNQLDESTFNGERGWVALSDQLAQSPQPNEDDVYATLNGIYNSIINQTNGVYGERLEPTTMFRTTANKAGKRDVAGRKTRPDGQSGLVVLPATKIVLRRSPRLAAKYGAKEKLPETSQQASGCAGIYEFKKDKADRHQNDKQMIHGASELFYNDPRRRFTFGLTIEKTATRLWYFNHSYICITEEFDCNKDPEALIRFFLYITFASEEQLGFDTTVERRAEAGEVYFLYKVEEKHYRTVGNPLAEDSAWLMNSRAVRVWTVRLADKKGKFLSETENVLKDAWLYDDNGGELAKQTELINAAKAVDLKTPPSPGEDKREDILLNLFVHIDHDWIVQVEDKDDKTLVHPQAAKLHTAVPNPARTAAATHRSKLELKYHVRVHRRTVFREKCIPFYAIDNIPLALQCISTYAQGLDVFREIGYIHRDISYGNCLVFISEGEEPIPKISDLEYCKAYKDISMHDPITGTLEFMATEVRTRRLLFRDRVKTDLDKALAEAEGVGNRRRRVKRVPKPQPPPATSDSEDEQKSLFHFHYYHDLEGLIWLFVWFILSYIPERFKGNVTTAQLYKWRVQFDSLFKDDPTALQDLFFDDYAKKLKAKIQSWGWYKGMEPVIGLLQTSFEGMGTTYAALQATAQDKTKEGFRRWSDDKFNAKMYDFIVLKFDKVLEAYPLEEQQDWKVKSMWDLPGARRSLSDLENEVMGSDLFGPALGAKRSANRDEDDNSEEEGMERRATKRANTREG
ncbi:hypothetical protein FA15DRAFT_727359 [Coprinopsis marcescibilis]|uniref:Fungal-type protein kinase domain-containing protein n=1 Tax=Coprinopsis marcescibilis TaxID=230819 RepID=A0A5C3KTH1_COPMA|nr:hypothetical protein FA15DRAFT_727359 [Coprinopsis marcescibilis]